MKKGKPVSACVPTYNEGAAVERLILSSLAATPLIREWVVVDHRSDDDTQERLDRLEPILSARGVRLVRRHEARDFGRDFRMADLRNACLRACSHKIAVMMDADFVLGDAFHYTLLRAQLSLNGRSLSVSFPIPVVWDHLSTDKNGCVRGHGRVWVHPKSDRIMLAEGVKYVQDLQGGRWFRVLSVTGGSTRRVNLKNDGSVLVSVNVKPAERIALRSTMTLFLQDVANGRKSGTWLQQYESGGLRADPPYPFVKNADLRGVKLKLPKHPWSADRDS